MPEVQVGRVRLYYERQGSGEPLLWITGYGSSSTIFDPVIPRYVRDFDCISFDNRGAGRSASIRGPVSIPDLAADATGLLDQLGVDSAHVLGVSMGGMIAQELAIRFPHRVRGLVLGCTTSGGHGTTLPGSREQRLILSRLREPPSAETLGELLFSESFRREADERLDASLRHFRAHRPSRSAIFGHLLAMLMHDTSRRLHLIQAPTIVVHGDQDALVPVENGRRLAAGVPGAELHVVEGAGHAFGMERPGRTYEVLQDWLERHAPIEAGVPPQGAAAARERLSRSLALPVGAAVLTRTLAGRCVAVEGGRRRESRHPRSGAVG